MHRTHLRRTLILSLALLVTLAVSPLEAAPGKMPSMVGQSETAARRMLTAIGLRVRSEAVVDGNVGKVVSHEPSAGQPYTQGQEVVLGIGVSAFVQTTMPNLVGMDEDKAVKALSGAYWLERRYVKGNPTQEGRILSQSVSPGARHPHRGRLILQILRNKPRAPGAIAPPAASGPRKVPDVKGLTMQAAEKVLRAAGFAPVFRAVGGGAGNSSKVIGQSPPGGAKAGAGARVSVYYQKVAGAAPAPVVPAPVAPGPVAPGPAALVAVPNVVGKNILDAKEILEKAGFHVVIDGVGIKVRRQAPAAGTKAQKGSRVRIKLKF